MTTMAPSASLSKEDPALMDVDKSDVVTDAVEKIVGACEGRNNARSAVFEATQGAAAADADTGTSAEGKPVSSATSALEGGGPLRAQEIAQLSRLCTSLSSSSLSSGMEDGNNSLGFGAVDGDLLVSSLFPLLQEHVRSAAQVDLVNEACKALEPGDNSDAGENATKMTVDEWLRGSSGSSNAGPGTKRVAVVKNGLESAAILLSIMTAPGIDRRITSEDCIEECISLFRNHLLKNIIPATTNTGHLQANSHAKTDPSPAKKLKKSPAKGNVEQRLIRSLKDVYKPILSSSDLFLALMERMDLLVQSVPLDDRPVLTLATTALSVFSMEPPSSSQQAEAGLCHLLHVASIGLITTIFQTYPKHRIILIEDLFPLVLKLPSSKKSIRTFCVHASSEGSTVKRTLFASGSVQQDQQCIQAFSALLLSLVQCCVEMPSFEAVEHSGGANSELPQLKSGLGQCQLVCNFFASQLLLRCAKKGEDGGASEYRPILGNLVDDLLSLLLSPEYPGAGMLLLTISRILSNDVVKASSFATAKSSNTSQHVESTYLATAFDVLGKIGATSARILAAYKAKPLKVSKGDNKPVQRDVSENSCHCGRTGLVHSFMVSCDECQGFFHGQCVGITKDTVPHVWFCDDCRLTQMVVDETKQFAKRSRNHRLDDDSEYFSETHVLRQLLLNYLTRQSGAVNSPAGQSARMMHLALWADGLCVDTSGGSEDATKLHVQRVLCHHFLGQWDDPSQLGKSDLTGRSSTRRCLNDEGNLRLMLNLTATKSELVTSFPSQLGLLLQLMADESQVSLRKLSVKATSQVIEADLSLMIHPAVKKSISLRFRDDAKSVREAAVALVGTFVVQTPEVANSFHLPLVRCLTDDGVSVKKRAIKIFRDILVSNPSYKGRAAACAVMLRQAANPKEDDSVRDLIHDLFTELWLQSDSAVPARAANGARRPQLAQCEAVEDTSNSESAARVPSRPGVVTPLTPEAVRQVKPQMPSPRSPEQTRSFCASEQMREVVMAADSRDALTIFLKELMCGFSDSDKDRKASERRKKNDAMHVHCSSLVDSLIEQLLILEENRSAHGENFGKKLVALVRTIAVFGEVAPSEVLRHLDTLVPYLKADNSVSRDQEAQIVSEMSDLVFRVTPVMSSGDLLRLTGIGVIDDLVSVTKKFGTGPLTCSMRALSGLVAHSGAGGEGAIAKKLMKVVTTFYGYLLKIKSTGGDFSSFDVKVRNNISRALSVLGAFCRHHKVEEEDWPGENDTRDEIPTDKLSLSNVMYACYFLFEYYLQQSDVSTKCAALRALSGIFVSRPRVMLMLEEQGAIEEIVSRDSPVQLQLEALRCWRDLLLAEENRVESGDAKARMDAATGITPSKKVAGDQDGDATLIGGVLTQHAPRLFQLTTSQDERIRYATVDLLGHLLRHGLLNPMETVPFLFAMQGDVQAPSVRALALKLLIVEGEKRPDMIRQRVCAGVKQTYRFQRTVYRTKLDVTATVKRKRGKNVEVECIFGAVFKECVQSSKKQRQGLYRNLLGLFTSDLNSDELIGRSTKKKTSMDQQLPLLSFAAQVLAHLPYNTASDPLFIIYHCSGTAALQGGQLIDRLSSFLQHYDLSSPDELDDHLFHEDALEKASKSKSPSRKEEIAVINSSDFDVAQFSQLCGEASAIVLVLRLKSFLRKVYNLSETRCIEYNPEAKDRVGEKAISYPPDMPVFDASIEPSVKPGDKSCRKSFDKDTLIRQYAEFRKLLREEHGSAARSDSDDSPETSRKRRGSESNG